MEFKKLTMALSPFVCAAIFCGCKPAEKVVNDERTPTADPAAKQTPDKQPEAEFRGIIGSDSEKIRKVGDKTYLWGGVNPESGEDEWYDFTGAPIEAAKLQFGIGKYRIAAIDDPVYVDPTDPRLNNVPVSPYRKDERPETPDEIMVVGWVEGADARAYPISLLDRHELVNDSIGGKPLTVGW